MAERWWFTGSSVVLGSFYFRFDCDRRMGKCSNFALPKQNSMALRFSRDINVRKIENHPRGSKTTQKRWQRTTKVWFNSFIFFKIHFSPRRVGYLLATGSFGEPLLVSIHVVVGANNGEFRQLTGMLNKFGNWLKRSKSMSARRRGGGKRKQRCPIPKNMQCLIPARECGPVYCLPN